MYFRDNVSSERNTFRLLGKSKKSRKEIMENQQNADAQRDRYYATIHKGIPGLAGDKIPGFLLHHCFLEIFLLK